MRIESSFILLFLVILSPPVRAQSAFNGIWRPNPEVYTATRKQDIFDLANGYFECRSCMPPYHIKADGLDQPISGNPNYDTLSIKAPDQRKVQKVAKKSGKTVAESAIAVSADGKSMTERQTIYFMAPRPVEITTRSLRLAGDVRPDG